MKKEKQKTKEKTKTLFLLLVLHENYNKIERRHYPRDNVPTNKQIEMSYDSNLSDSLAAVRSVAVAANQTLTLAMAGLDKKCRARITVDGSTAKSTSHKHCTNVATQASSLCNLCFEAKNAHLNEWKKGSTSKNKLMFLGPVRKDQYPNYGGARGHGWHGIFGGSIPYFANKGLNSQVSQTEPKEYSLEASRKFGYE